MENKLVLTNWFLGARPRSNSVPRCVSITGADALPLTDPGQLRRGRCRSSPPGGRTPPRRGGAPGTPAGVSTPSALRPGAARERCFGPDAQCGSEAPPELCSEPLIPAGGGGSRWQHRGQNAGEGCPVPGPTDSGGLPGRPPGDPRGSRGRPGRPGQERRRRRGRGAAAPPAGLLSRRRRRAERPRCPSPETCRGPSSLLLAAAPSEERSGYGRLENTPKPFSRETSRSLVFNLFYLNSINSH